MLAAADARGSPFEAAKWAASTRRATPSPGLVCRTPASSESSSNASSYRRRLIKILAPTRDRIQRCLRDRPGNASASSRSVVARSGSPYESSYSAASSTRSASVRRSGRASALLTNASASISRPIWASTAALRTRSDEVSIAAEVASRASAASSSSVSASRGRSCRIETRPRFSIVTPKWCGYTPRCSSAMRRKWAATVSRLPPRPPASTE